MMLGALFTIVAVVLALFLLPPLLASIPARWRRGGSGLGPALSELNAVFNPAERHVEAAQREVRPEREIGEPED